MDLTQQTPFVKTNTPDELESLIAHIDSRHITRFRDRNLNYMALVRDPSNTQGVPETDEAEINKACARVALKSGCNGVASDPAAIKVAYELHLIAKPLMTAVFGSRITGGYTYKSDIDLLIVTKDLLTPEQGEAITAYTKDIAAKYYGRPVDLQIIGITDREYQKENFIKGGIISDALLDGIIFSDCIADYVSVYSIATPPPVYEWGQYDAYARMSRTSLRYMHMFHFEEMPPGQEGLYDASILSMIQNKKDKGSNARTADLHASNAVQESLLSVVAALGGNAKSGQSHDQIKTSLSRVAPDLRIATSIPLHNYYRPSALSMLPAEKVVEKAGNDIRMLRALATRLRRTAMAESAQLRKSWTPDEASLEHGGNPDDLKRAFASSLWRLAKPLKKAPDSFLIKWINSLPPSTVNMKWLPPKSHKSLSIGQDGALVIAYANIHEWQEITPKVPEPTSLVLIGVINGTEQEVVVGDSAPDSVSIFRDISMNHDSCSLTWGWQSALDGFSQFDSSEIRVASLSLCSPSEVRGSKELAKTLTKTFGTVQSYAIYTDDEEDKVTLWSDGWDTLLDEVA